MNRQGCIAFPFFADKAAGSKVRLVAVEPSSCPSLTKGVYTYDFGDAVGMTPLVMMYTLSHDFMPPGTPPLPFNPINISWLAVAISRRGENPRA